MVQLRYQDGSMQVRTLQQCSTGEVAAETARQFPFPFLGKISDMHAEIIHQRRYDHGPGHQ